MAAVTVTADLRDYLYKELQFALRQVDSLSNQGRLGEADWSYETIAVNAKSGGDGVTGVQPLHEHFLNQSETTPSNANGRADSAALETDGWQTFFAVDADLHELMKMLKPSE